MPESVAARVLRWLTVFERVVALTAFFVLVLVVFGDVVSRELSGAGLYWASQTAVWANVLVVMAGFGLASANGAHLRPKFSDHWLPASWDGALQTLQHAFMALFSLALGLLAATVTLETWQRGEISIQLMVPVWPVQLFLPLAFLTAALRHSLYAWVPAVRPQESSALTDIAAAGKS